MWLRWPAASQLAHGSEPQASPPGGRASGPLCLGWDRSGSGEGLTLDTVAKREPLMKRTVSRCVNTMGLSEQGTRMVRPFLLPFVRCGQNVPGTRVPQCTAKNLALPLHNPGGTLPDLGQ